MDNDISKFNKENLKPLVGQSFTVKDQQGKSVNVVLSELNEQNIKGVEAETFATIFTCKAGSIPEDAVYEVEHAEIGNCALAISQNSETECEIVVSRLKTPIAPPEAEKDPNEDSQ